jgi:glycosyltransferase involved in cell wall biosynthesis
MQTPPLPAIPPPGPERPGARIWGSTHLFVEDGPVLGRKVANATFLEALLRLDPFDSYHFFSQGDDSALRLWLQEHFPGLLRRQAVRIGRHELLPKSLSETAYHCMHLSDGVSHFTQLAQLRNVASATLFPITGVTHSLSYERFMPAYLKHLWSGVSPRDSLIVTSESVRLMMGAVFSGLRHEYGLSRETFPGPRLKKIPLGVDPPSLPSREERWDAPCDPPHAQRSLAAREMRSRLGLREEVLFLYLGRICPYSKMDLMPLFPALRRAEGLGLPKNGHVLVLAGWTDEDQALPGLLQDYAASMGLRLVALPRPTDAQRRALYAAADVFLSPSDNIQESFGLTVAEAGAAGLPVIASDFDGYRDIVLHEETGLLIPTLGFTDTAETDLLAMFWFDNQYHLKAAQSCAVHVPALAEALSRLGTDAALRRRMGEAGRKRIRDLFSWDAVIKRYLAHWEELAALPLTKQEEERLRAARHPQRMRFAEFFRGHFSRTLVPAELERMLLRRTQRGHALYRGLLPLAHYAGMGLLLDGDAVHLMLHAARKQVAGTRLLHALEDFFRKQSPEAFVRERAAFTLLWALKHDYLEYTE